VGESIQQQGEELHRKGLEPTDALRVALNVITYALSH